jgi:hypothetical protein
MEAVASGCAPFEAFKIRSEVAQGLRRSQPPGDVSTQAARHSDIQMLMAITTAQLQDVVSLADRLSQARRATGHAQSPDEVLRDPERWELTDYLYSLSDEARCDLILLMLVGRGDVKHASERAAEACLKYRSADDQVAYLLSKSIRLAEYLKIGMLALVAIIHRRQLRATKTLASRRR